MNETHIQDRTKLLYQQTFGGGHMVADAAASLKRIEEECARLESVEYEEPLFEAIGGDSCRMHLRPLMQTGLSPRVANAMFVYSANHHPGGDVQAFIRQLRRLAATDEEHGWVADYIERGCPPTSHSGAYRKAHKPAYRVVDRLFADAFPLILRMDALGAGIVSLDGPCASGKSTLAVALAEVFGITVLHVDDFFLQPEQRTPERLAEAGGNFDRERLLQEVLAPLKAGGPFTFRPYNCAVQEIGDPVEVTPTPLVLLEGVYGQHPDLRDSYALKAFADVEPDVQRERLLARNGAEMLKRFEAEWIPMENKYFDAFDVRQNADITLWLGQDD